jgi:hypothetical protein
MISFSFSFDELSKLMEFYIVSSEERHRRPLVVVEKKEASEIHTRFSKPTSWDSTAHPTSNFFFREICETFVRLFVIPYPPRYISYIVVRLVPSPDFSWKNRCKDSTAFGRVEYNEHTWNMTTSLWFLFLLLWLF